MKYRMFSSLIKWLPEEPTEMILNDLDNVSTLDVTVESMAVCGGDTELSKAFELAAITGTDTIIDKSKRNLIKNFTNMLPILKQLDKVCLRQLNRRFQFDEDDSNYHLSESKFAKDYKIKDEICMDFTASKLKGCIYWITSHTRDTILTSIRLIEPELLVPRDILNKANIPIEKGTKRKRNQLLKLKSHHLNVAKTVVAVADRVINDRRFEVSTSVIENDFSFQRILLSRTEFLEYKESSWLREKGLLENIL